MFQDYLHRRKNAKTKEQQRVYHVKVDFHPDRYKNVSCELLRSFQNKIERYDHVAAARMYTYAKRKAIELTFWQYYNNLEGTCYNSSSSVKIPYLQHVAFTGKSYVNKILVLQKRALKFSIFHWQKRPQCFFYLLTLILCLLILFIANQCDFQCITSVTKKTSHDISAQH